MAANSAAARVFAIPELLEKILFHIAIDELPEPLTATKPTIAFTPFGYVEPKHEKLYFVKSPFILQQVNRTFLATIAGSTKLQTLKLTCRGQHGDAELHTDAHLRLSWLVKAMGGWTLRTVTSIHEYHDITAHSYIMKQALHGYRYDTPRIRSYDGASWRSTPILIPPVDKDVQLRIETSAFLMFNPFPYQQKKQLRINGETTLGELYDKLEQVEEVQKKAERELKEQQMKDWIRVGNRRRPRSSSQGIQTVVFGQGWVED